MIPFDIQVSRSKGKVKGQAYASHVGEREYKYFTNIHFYVGVLCLGFLIMHVLALS